MQLSALAFPDHYPSGYEDIADGVEYNADIHLDLQAPKRIWKLSDFGYSEEQIAACASEVAVSSPFRLLSDKGVADLHQIVTRLKSVSSHIEGNRTPSHLAGGVYRSRFLRDMCACPRINAHMSEIAGTTLVTHSMPSQQVYVNYAPDDISKAVDSWHYDGIGFDYVLMMSDPQKIKGGNFEYFQGTRDEIAEMFDLKVHEVRYGITADLPEERVIKAQFPGAGYAIFQQGNLVVHRAARILEPADRITIVPGLVALDVKAHDPTAKHDMRYYNEPGIIAEIARHSAWLSQQKIQGYLNRCNLNQDKEQIRQALQGLIADVVDTMDLIDQYDAQRRKK